MTALDGTGTLSTTYQHVVRLWGSISLRWQFIAVAILTSSITVIILKRKWIAQKAGSGLMWIGGNHWWQAVEGFRQGDLIQLGESIKKYGDKPSIRERNLSRLPWRSNSGLNTTDKSTAQESGVSDPLTELWGLNDRDRVQLVLPESLRRPLTDGGEEIIDLSDIVLDDHDLVAGERYQVKFSVYKRVDKSSHVRLYFRDSGDADQTIDVLKNSADDIEEYQLEENEVFIVDDILCRGEEGHFYFEIDDRTTLIDSRVEYEERDELNQNEFSEAYKSAIELIISLYETFDITVEYTTDQEFLRQSGTHWEDDLIIIDTSGDNAVIDELSSLSCIPTRNTDNVGRIEGCSRGLFETTTSHEQGQTKAKAYGLFAKVPSEYEQSRSCTVISGTNEIATLAAARAFVSMVPGQHNGSIENCNTVLDVCESDHFHTIFPVDLSRENPSRPRIQREDICEELNI